MSKPKITITYNAPVTITFAIIAFLALFLDKFTAGWTTHNLFMVYKSSWYDPLFYVRLFGHVLGHSNYAHYIGNMLYILLLGPGLEEKYGSKKFLSFIMLTALATGLFHIFFGRGALLGASGVVFMCIVLASFTSVRKQEIPLTAILVLILYLGQEILTGLTAMDNISQITHVIGGVVGFILGLTVKGRH